jgi:hypothetical protein
MRSTTAVRPDLPEYRERGCGDTDPETLIEELRLVASVAEPPEVEPGEPFDFSMYFSNPDDVELEAVTWVCTNLGDGCLEAAGSTASIATSTLAPDQSVWTESLAAGDALFGILPETGPLSATAVWTLACEAGSCPLFEDAGDIVSGEPWSDESTEQLSNPLDWMADLPTNGVSLAYRLITVTTETERHNNPSLVLDQDSSPELRKNKTFTLSFTVDGTFSDEARLYNYISAGGFMITDTFVNSGECITIEGTAPKKSGPVTIWAVLNDGLGGTAVWTETVVVQ